MINRNFKDFKFQHKRNQNQVLFSSKKIKGDNEVLNLIDNFLAEKNSFIFESVEKGIVKGRYTIFGKKPDKIWEFNKKIVDKINENKFTHEKFKDLSAKNSIKIEKTRLDSINDNKKFTEKSMKLIYSMPPTSYLLVNDVENNIYLVNILKINEENLSKNSDEFKNFEDQGMMKLRDQMYSTYDNFINDKYKVKINQKTLERVKNYFK